jgi:hypothetical protein
MLWQPAGPGAAAGTDGVTPGVGVGGGVTTTGAGVGPRVGSATAITPHTLVTVYPVAKREGHRGLESMIEHDTLCHGNNLMYTGKN